MKNASIDNPFLYEKAASAISKLIESGTLHPGDKVPSVRKFSKQQGVSISTAMRAYRLLEDSGFIETRPQSGSYVRRMTHSLPPRPTISSPDALAVTVEVSDLVAKVYETVRETDIMPLGNAAGPCSTLLPTQKLNRILARVARDAGGQGVGYDFPPGNDALRRQIARRSLDWGCNLLADDVIITSGCMEAMNLALRAVAKPGDIIAIESPTYYGALQAIESAGMRALEISTCPEDGINLDALERALDTHPVKACLLIPNFNNPIGSCMPVEKKRQLVAMLTLRQIPLIEEDLLGDVYFGDTRPVAAKSFDTEGLVLLCSSFSKTLAPGYRIGWIAPGRYWHQVERLKFITNIATPSITQMAVAEFLHNGGYDHHLRQLRMAVQAQMQRSLQAISEYFPEGTKATRPTGGFVLWIELPKQVDVFQLNRLALEHKIGIAPGPIFSAQPQYRNCIRINCGRPWSSQLEQTFYQLGSLAKRLAGA